MILFAYENWANECFLVLLHSLVLPLSKVILCKPVHGPRGRGHPRATTFVDNLLIDTGVETTGKLETLMLELAGSR